MLKKIAFVLALLLLIARASFSAPGDFDSSFGTNGLVFYESSRGDEEARGVAIQADGKIVVVGYTWLSELDVLLLRYNSDGTLDNTFGTNGVVTYNGLRHEEGYGVALQPDGKIVVVGYTTSPDVYKGPNVLVLRFNSDGSLDNTFGTNGVGSYGINTDDYGYAVAIQSDGKIVVVGETSSGDNLAFVLRCNSDGTLDNTFGVNGVFTYNGAGGGWDHAYGVAIQSNGKIVVTGNTSTASALALTDLLVLRLTSNGTLDNTFGTGGIFTYSSNFSTGQAVVLQTDEKIVIAGGSWSYSDPNSALVLRFKTDGTLDTTFGTNGVASYTGLYGVSVALQPDKKILVGTSPVLRFRRNGQLDPIFGNEGVAEYISANSSSIALQKDGKIVVAGSSRLHDQSSDYDVLIFRLLADVPPETEPGALFWSMCVGNSWVYDGSDLGGGSWAARDEIVGSDTTTIPGVKTYRVETSENGTPFGYTWYSVNLAEVKEWQEKFWGDVGLGPEWITVSYYSGLIWAKNPIIVGDHWITTTAGTMSGSTGWSIPINISLDVTVQDYESINVPLGSYKAYKFRQIVHIWNYDYGVDVTNTQYGWFIPYIGIIKLLDELNNSTEVLSSMSIKKVIVDYDGDGKTDIAVYRGSTGAWYVYPSGGSSAYGFGWGGDPTDKPAPGDYDGDGKTDIAVYRTGTGAWYVYPSDGGAAYGFGWGGDATDKSASGDYDGDGKTDIAVYRSGTGAWYVSLSGGGAPYGFGWGGDASDKPAPGDYDGDGKTDIVVYRAGTGAWYVYPSGGGAPYGFGWGGDATDKPAPGDYDGDGKTDIAVYRSGTGVWYVYPSGGGPPYGRGWGGDASDKPAPGDYDGDGKTDCAVYRTSTGAWYVYPSGGTAPFGLGWGGDASDKPVTMNPASIE